jgi:indole-3-glycerol phosphate synthase/phosphoribosylanthranilate isomerase
MPTILEKIVVEKRKELEAQKAQVSQSQLEQRIKAQPMPLNLSGALMGDRVRLIAEVKKASPSRGLLTPNFDPMALATTYVNNGAAAISVLTDPRFQGTPEHLIAVKEATKTRRVPVLRKDFIFDSYQVMEARAWAADALLLIVAILSAQQLKDLLRLCQRFWLQTLVEVHNEAELEQALQAGAEIIGINNRDLHTFKTDLAVTERLVPKVPRGKIIVSESGIFTAQDVTQLRGLRVNAVLVGEALVTSQDTPAKVRELAGQPVEASPVVKVKICGLMRAEEAIVAARAGADFLGVVFVPGRRRRVSAQQARAVVDAVRATAQASMPKLVGLFADQPLDEVNHTIEETGLDTAQLCGKESLDYSRQIKADVIKVFHVPAGADSETASRDLYQRMRPYLQAGHTVTLDRMVEGLQGGTGESFDWNIASKIAAAGHRFILAGGLTPGNVSKAIAAAHPWGVDVSSGVETNGAKDHDKIQRFVKEARRASVAPGKKS